MLAFYDENVIQRSSEKATLYFFSHLKMWMDLVEVSTHMLYLCFYQSNDN